MKEKETIWLDYGPELPEGATLVAVKRATDRVWFEPGYIVLAVTEDQYITTWLREKDSSYAHSNYFRMEEFKEAVEDFFSRQ